MNTKNFFGERAIWIVALLFVVTVIGGFTVLNDYIYQEKQGNGTVTEPYRATLTGVQVCLPHKDTSGPQTLECAIGMKTDVGEYYVLDFNPMSQTPPEIQNGQRFTASGLITPIERLNTDQWKKYDVEGIFSITDSIKIEGKIDEPEKPVTSGECFIGGCSSQLCSDTPDMVSTCEYREQYACYKTAKCERQSTGQCGWTQTSELSVCLDASLR